MNGATRVSTYGRVMGLLLCCIWLLVTGCGGEERNSDDSGEQTSDESRDHDDGDEGSDSSRDELVPVEVTVLGSGEIEAVMRFSSNLEAENEVQVFSQAARLVTELMVEEGDSVEAGDLLVRLQAEEQRSQIAKTESQLARAQRELERQQNLFAQELVTEQAFNDANYEVEQLRLTLADARRELGYTEVRAPIAGRITNRLVSLGDHITVNQHLFDIVDFDSIVARVYVPERELNRLQPGKMARIFSESLGTDQSRSGTVIRMAPIVDPRSGTVKVTVGIPRREGLLPGMYVEVELVTETHQQALLVPKRAIVFDSGQGFVFRMIEVEEELRVVRVPIAVRLEDQDFVEPEDGDLEVGQQVVIAGQAGLKDGGRVRLAGAVQAVEDNEAD